MIEISRKIGEEDLTIPILHILSLHAPLTTTDMISILRSQYNFTGDNASILHNRNDEKITQIIRNIVSHKNNKSNIIFKELVTYSNATKEWNITKKGISYLGDYIGNTLI